MNKGRVTVRPGMSTKQADSGHGLVVDLIGDVGNMLGLNITVEVNGKEMRQYHMTVNQTSGKARLSLIEPPEGE